VGGLSRVQGPVAGEAHPAPGDGRASVTIPAIAESLRFAQGDATWERLRKKALTDLYFFNAVVRGLGEKIPMRDPTHLAMCRFAERRTGIPRIDSAPIQKIEVPRDVGKTSMITQGLTTQRLAAAPNETRLIFNEKLDTAAKFLSAIKQEFERNTLFRNLFPEIIPDDFNKTTWSATEMIIPRDTTTGVPSVMVSGVGGAVTGLHPNHIIVDDMISDEAAQNARKSKGQLIKDTNYWINTLDALLDQNTKPFPTITFIGTRWWYGDSYEYVEQAFGYGEEPEHYDWFLPMPDGSKQVVRLTRVGDLAIFRRSAIEKGASIFPEKWSLEQLAKKRLRDPVLFAANYMNQPSDEVTATFKMGWLRYFEWEDGHRFRFFAADGAKKTLGIAETDNILICDPGGFGDGYGRDRARPGIVVTGTKDNLQFLLDCFCEDETYLQAAHKVVAMAKQYRVRKIAIERAGQQAAFIDKVKELLRAAGITCAVEEVKPGLKDKDDRILELEGYFQNGQVYVARGAKMGEFLEQYQQFPRGRKDLLDALSYGPRLWKKPSLHQSQQQRQDMERAAYLARRGLTQGYAR
jgi:predicted phage terminase large subunit-like protein